MRNRRLIYVLSLGTLAFSLEAFLHPRFAPRHLRRTHNVLVSHLAAAKKNSKIFVPPLKHNEFSRTVQPERILKSRRDFMIDVEASRGERNALAARFELTEIDALRASLALRREGERTTGVEVEGAVTASVTQTCVRTNEQFQMDLEFPLFCVVRPVRPLLLQESSPTAVGMRESRSSQASSSASQNNNKKSKYRPQDDRSIEEMDVMELQQLLQDDIISSEESYVVMEDEAIYSTDSLLDVGELVSQLFWLQLDPYPKKPGSGPVQTSITG